MRINALARRCALLPCLLLLAGCPDKDPSTTSTTGQTDATTDPSSSGPAPTSGSSTTELMCLVSPCNPTSGDSGTSLSGSTGGTTGAPPPELQCQQSGDCVLIDDCCECDAKHVDEPVDRCMIDCPGTKCGLQLKTGIEVACRSGVCEFAEVQCTGQVACDALPPTCPEGTVNSIAGACWGPCVEPRYCAEGSCDPQDPASCGAGWTCVEHQAGGASCEVLPAGCAGVPTCACMQPFFSEFCGGSCGESGGAILCEDGG